MSIRVTHPVVARCAADVSEARAYAVQALFTVFWPITRLEGGVLPALALLGSAGWSCWIGLSAAALIGPTREDRVGLQTQYISRAVITGRRRDVIRLALRAAAIAVFEIAVVAGLAPIDHAVTTLVVLTIGMSRKEPAPEAERLDRRHHVA